MGLILDTSLLIAAEREERTVEDLLGAASSEAVHVSAITASELLHGVHRATPPARRAKREAFVEQFLQGFPVLPFDLTVARVYARIWSALAARGEIVGAHDLIIGSTALAHDLSVVTRDARSFPKIPGLAVLRR